MARGFRGGCGVRCNIRSSYCGVNLTGLETTLLKFRDILTSLTSRLLSSLFALALFATVFACLSLSSSVLFGMNCSIVNLFGAFHGAPAIPPPSCERACCLDLGLRGGATDILDFDPARGKFGAMFR